MIKHEVEKDDGKKSNKLAAGLKKLSHEQLAELHDAVSAELKHRAKKAKSEKKPSEMTDKQFETWAAKQIAKHETGEADDD